MGRLRLLFLPVTVFGLALTRSRANWPGLREIHLFDLALAWPRAGAAHHSRHEPPAGTALGRPLRVLERAEDGWDALTLFDL